MKMKSETIHVFNRRAIMRRAWELARQAREEKARRAFDLGARVVGARIIYARTYAECLASTPLDLGAAQRAAWAEARKVNNAPHGGALVVVRQGGELAPLRRFRGRVLPLLLTVARWIGGRFIRARAA
jgi:hypothetical protein